MPNAQLAFAFALLILCLAACARRGERAVETETTQAETNVFVNEMGHALQEVDDFEPLQGNDAGRPSAVSDSEGYFPNDGNVVRPRDARAFCANSRDTFAEIEQDAATLPIDVARSG